MSLKVTSFMNGPQRTFECQIRIKRVSNVQKRCHMTRTVWNRLEPVPEPVRPKCTFECQIRIKRVSNVQKKVSHDRNRLELFGTVWNRFRNRFGSGHVTPHFARLNATLPEFAIKMDPKLAEPFFGSGTGTVRFQTVPSIRA